MAFHVQEHTEPLLDDKRGDSLDVEEGRIREKGYPTARFYEKKSFLAASILWFSGAVLFLISAFVLRKPSRAAFDTIYCEFSGQELYS